MKPDKKISNTCIAIIKNRQGKLLMAGDRRSSWGYHYAQSMDIPKINKKDGVLLGATGHGDMCSLFVDDGGFEIPEQNVKLTAKYMYHIFKPAVIKFLLNQGYGYSKDRQTHLKLPPGTYCEVVIGISGEAWSMTIENPCLEESEFLEGHVSVGRVSIPYATGCGGHGTADAILRYELKRKGYITKEELRQALEIVADISPGCDDEIDIIGE